MKLKLIGILLLALLQPLSAWAEPEAGSAAQEVGGEHAKKADNTKPLPKSVKPPRKLEGGWVLDWYDEFNGSKLDTKKWNYELGVKRNRGCSQAYVKDCVKVKDGVLQLISKAQKTPNETFGKRGVAPWASKIKTQPYASGSITTLGTRTFVAPGRLEFRARIPKAKGVWPAIWTMHQNKYGWPANGEIDLLEHVSQEPNTVYTIFRWGKNGTSEEFKPVVSPTKIPELSKEFHTYVLEWDKEMMTAFIDGKMVASIKTAEAQYPNGDNPLLTPCYLIMNTAIGGPGTWAETADAPDQYPVTFEIDYVRFYKRSAGATKNKDNSKKSSE